MRLFYEVASESNFWAQLFYTSHNLDEACNEQILPALGGVHNSPS